MTKVEAIKKVLENNGGVATWDIIYNQIEKYYSGIKNSAEWEAGIRGVLYREIKNEKNFKRIGLSLYGLLDYKEEKYEEVKKQNEIRIHSFMEGICLEIGNFLKLDTFTADPSATYNNLSLSKIATLNQIPDFTYPNIIDSAKRIDVVWLNNKGYKFPKRAIEIINSIGTLEPALKRTLQLLEFNLSFYIIGKPDFKSKIERELSKEPYLRIRERYVVKDYEEIMNIYKNPIAFMKEDFLRVENYF